MVNELATTIDRGALEAVLVEGNLSVLSPQQRAQYYLGVCESLGLNHLTKPFQYITLNGRLTLYATKACTDQLRRLHGVSIDAPDIKSTDGLFVVSVLARDKEGRTDSDLGVVPVGGLKGEALTNAMMKAMTKAKRRVTLSLCGLGMLDESEVDSIPGARVVDVTDAHDPADRVGGPEAAPAGRSPRGAVAAPPATSNAGGEAPTPPAEGDTFTRILGVETQQGKRGEYWRVQVREPVGGDSLEGHRTRWITTFSATVASDASTAARLGSAVSIEEEQRGNFVNLMGVTPIGEPVPDKAPAKQPVDDDDIPF